MGRSSRIADTIHSFISIPPPYVSDVRDPYHNLTASPQETAHPTKSPSAAYAPSMSSARDP